MADHTVRKKAHRKHHRHHWRRDLVELAALFTAVTIADTVAKTVAGGPDGPVLLIISAGVLLATAGFHTWWARRFTHAPPPLDTGATAAEPTAEQGGTALWRMRTTVRDEPGSLAAVSAALASLRADILTLQTHPLSEGTVDEFLLRAPAALDSGALSGAVGAAGGRETWLERADAHDLVDTPTRVLQLAARTALDAAELPLALRKLLGRCTIRSLPAVSPGGRPAVEQVPEEGVMEGTEIRLREPSGGTIVIERPQLPFTPAEFARTRALVDLDARLGPRIPRRRDVTTLHGGSPVTVRRAGPADGAAAREMHDRCSRRTLGLRYHGPVADADRYLGHLLSPRFGRTLAVENTSGQLVALGHLLWDGEEAEVALLVEDAWQRRGIGGELLGRLLELASEAGYTRVYAVTQAANTGMVATMRGLGLPLDYQVEDATLVITAEPGGQQPAATGSQTATAPMTAP